jgi:ADP-ribosyl-[dinitrogen reductase] hydrolase
MGEVSLKDRVRGGFWGAVAGDALGLPVQFRSREEVKARPVTGMTGYGTFNMPPGTWSDDSSLLLCTVEALLDGFDTGRMGGLFVRWLTEGYRTPFGYAFDIGYSTGTAIKRIASGIVPEEAGGTAETDNGNGSLMRILPVGIFGAGFDLPDLLDACHRVSALTHRHPRSQMACGFYCLMACALLQGATPADAYGKTVEAFKAHYRRRPYAAELGHFERLIDGSISKLSSRKIKSGGYVVHTLEASIWCLLNTGSFAEAVLLAVNLGEDTDTNGCVTGGLAGILYGLDAIPTEWVSTIVGKNDIAALFERFWEKVAPSLTKCV